jgi:hypothetical protein
MFADVFPDMSDILGANPLDFLTKGISNDVAESIIQKGDPIVRDMIAANRLLIADSVISGLPFVVAAGIGAVATHYLVPFDFMKAGTYALSIGLGGYGIYRTFSTFVTEQARAAAVRNAQASSIPGAAQAAIDETVAALVKSADPRIRQIIDQERTRLASATQAGLPWVVGGILGGALTFVLMPDNAIFKSLGYAGSIALAGAGTWIGLEKMK